MVRSPNERSFFSNLGEISHAETIRKTIFLARKNAEKRRTSSRLPEQSSDLDLRPENDINQNYVSNIAENIRRDALDTAAIELVAETRGDLTTINSEKRCLCSSNGNTHHVSVERTRPTIRQAAGKPENTEKSAKVENTLHSEMSTKHNNDECDRNLNLGCSGSLDQVGTIHLSDAKRQHRNPCLKPPSELSPSTLFKARPLPGGIWVENDLFASTVSTRGKNKRLQTEEVEGSHKAVELNESFKIRRRRDPSASPSIASDSLPSTAISYRKTDRCLKNNAASPSEVSTCHFYNQAVSPKASTPFGIDNKERELKDKMKKLNCFLKKAREFSSGSSFNKIQENALSEGEGKVSLEREVEKLDKQLKRRRKLALEIIDVLGLDNAQYYPSNVQKDTGESWAGSLTESKSRIRQQNIVNFKRYFSPVHSTVDTMGGSNQRDPGGTLYKRQERWLESKEKRLREYRIFQKMELMEGFTGVPLLSDAKGSWEKAKAAHALAARHQLEEEKRREMEKEVRLQHVEYYKGKELEELYADAEKRKLALTSKIDRGRQQEASKKLARPRAKVKPAIKEEEEIKESLTSCALDSDGRSARKVYSKRNKKKQTGKGKLQLSAQLSYADMDDEQFARVMKSIGIDMSSYS